MNRMPYYILRSAYSTCRVECVFPQAGLSFVIPPEGAAPRARVTDKKLEVT